MQETFAARTDWPAVGKRHPLMPRPESPSSSPPAASQPASWDQRDTRSGGGVPTTDVPTRSTVRTALRWQRACGTFDRCLRRTLLMAIALSVIDAGMALSVIDAGMIVVVLAVVLRQRRTEHEECVRTGEVRDRPAERSRPVGQRAERAGDTGARRVLHRPVATPRQRSEPWQINHQERP